MIYYYGRESIATDMYLHGLRVCLGCDVYFFEGALENRDIDLLILNSRDIHWKTQRKMIDMAVHQWGCPVVLMSDKEELLPDINAVVPVDIAADKLADICQCLIGDKAAPADNIKFSFEEESILRNLMLGHSNKQIAREYDFTLSSVKYYLQNIYKKLSVDNRTQAALKLHEITLS